MSGRRDNVEAPLPDAAEPELRDLEIERQMLAVILQDNGIIERLGLREEIFAHPLHRLLYEIMRRTIHRGATVTVVALSTAVPEAPNYPLVVAETFAVVSEAQRYATTLRELAARRKVREIADGLRARAQDMTVSVDEIVANATAALMGTPTGRQGSRKRAVAERIIESLRKPLAVYSTGLPTLNEAMGGGLMAGKLYGIAARKKIGKTLLLGSISHNLNHAGIPHLFIALEMSSEEIEQRNIARQRGFNSIKFLTRDLPDLENRVADYIATVPDNTIYEHAPGAGFDEIRAMIGRARLAGIKGVVLDYLQLVGGKGKTETEEAHTRAVSQWLADEARRCGLWAIVAAQLNQDGNTRGGEGLRLACDQYYVLHREKDQIGAWLQCQESRYTILQSVGSESVPGFWLHSRGPHFSETPPPYAPAPGGAS